MKRKGRGWCGMGQLYRPHVEEVAADAGSEEEMVAAGEEAGGGRREEPRTRAERQLAEQGRMAQTGDEGYGRLGDGIYSNQHPRMASPSAVSLTSSPAALPAGPGAPRPRLPPCSVRPFGARHQHQPRRVVAAAAARRRYKGTARKEAALAALVERKVAEAMEACDGEGRSPDDDAGCRVAWDEVEEVSQARADLRRRIAESPAGDPLEPFCARNPAADDCAVVYVDD
ncbi:hypothetical protein U9M48_038305 [Paspalum notatum var. saurae]|uniref:CP12 domain-containing protein n=1 Tax=Paspalum notatum var. saurae TaxID=547442 RepID=A0AAQ3ULK7_PASNO